MLWILLLACASELVVTWPEHAAPDDTGGVPLQALPGVHAWGPCEPEEEIEDYLGCCLDACRAVEVLCERCGEGADVCANARAGCERACESYCDERGCDDFDPVGESSFAECGEVS